MELSFLLYTINFFVSLTTTNQLWKLLNFLLIITSCLCNKGELFLYLDYFCIFFISLCFLNHFTINMFFVSAMICEYYALRTITIIKNMTFVTAAVIHVMTINFLQTWIGLVTLTALIVYTIRYYYPNNYLTLLWRFCTMVIMVTASYNIQSLTF